MTKVYDELVAGNDDLADWIRDRKNDGRFLEVSDPETQKRFAAIAQHVQSATYHEPAKAKFLDSADPWLIAKASVVGARVVTHEKLDRNIRRRVPIPNVCGVMGVDYTDTFDLLRRCAAAFRL